MEWIEGKVNAQNKKIFKMTKKFFNFFSIKRFIYTDTAAVGIELALDSYLQQWYIKIKKR